MPSHDALRLLAGGPMGQTELAEARAVCEALGWLTLAVAVAARTLKLRGWRPAQLLREIRRQGALKWTAAKSADPVFQKNPSIAVLFRGSLEQAAEGEEGKRARAMALAGGWFASVGIGRQDLFRATRRLLAQQDSAAMEDSAAADEEAERDEIALEQLTRVGLGKLEQTGDVVFHRLVQEFLRELGGSASRAAVLAELAQTARQVPQDTLALLQVAPLRPHWEESALRLREDDPEDTLWLCLRLVQHLRKKAEYAAGLSFCDKALAQAGYPRLSCDWRSRFLNERGQILSRQGGYDAALKTYEEALRVRRHLGLEDDLTATLLRNTGETLDLKGRHEEALGYYEQALAIEEKRPDEEACVANTLDAMGSSLRILKRFPEAERCLDRAIAIKEKLRSGDNPARAKTLRAIGQLLSDTRRYEEALGCLDRALVIETKILGNQHPGTLLTRFKRGVVRRALGQVEAEEELRLALAGLRELFGDDHPEVRWAAEAMSATSPSPALSRSAWLE